MAFTPIRFSRELPAGIRNAIERKTLVIFIGAGISQLMGGWSWDKLVEELVKKCRSVNCINSRQEEHLINLSRKEKKYVEMITQCHEMLSDVDINHYYDVIKQSCDVQTMNKKFIDVYSLFKKISEYFITTNYDPYFDTSFSIDNIVYKLEEIINSVNLDKNKLYHIHGSIVDPSSLVLTQHDYHERYENMKNYEYKTFLKNIFTNFNVLFLGYGLSEYVITTILYPAKAREKKHYVLSPYYSNQSDDLDYDDRRLSRMGVNVVPYLKDEIRYQELYEVLKSWENDLFGMQLEVENI